MYHHHGFNQNQQPTLLIPFFEKNFTLQDYLKLDDNVLNSYFVIWQDHPDAILNDLAKRFLDRRPLKSVSFTAKTKKLIPYLQKLVAQAGFDPEYYTAINDSYDLPYDTYSPDTKAQIEIMLPDKAP